MAGTITALRIQKRNRERVNVYLDDEYAFALPAIEAANLHKGQFLSDAEITNLRTLDLRSKAYDKAVRYLAVRPRSEREVRRRLGRYRSKKREKLPDAHIDWVIDKLMAQGYLDDSEFARYWVEQRNRFKPRSPRALRYELRQKGVSDRIIESVLTDGVDAAEAALAAARSRLSRWQHLDEERFRKKMIGFLQRRGFTWHITQQTVEQVWQESEETP